MRLVYVYLAHVINVRNSQTRRYYFNGVSRKFTANTKQLRKQKNTRAQFQLAHGDRAKWYAKLNVICTVRVNRDRIEYVLRVKKNALNRVLNSEGLTFKFIL